MLQMKTAALVLAGSLAACGDTTRFELSPQVALGQMGHVDNTLARARSDFLGEDPDPLLSGVSEVPVDYVGGGSLVTRIAIARADNLAPGVTLTSALFAEHSQIIARLPQGLGVFTDPMQVALWANAIGGEVAAGHARVYLGGQVVTYSAGLGLTRVMSRVHLTSALIDLRSATGATIPYATFSGRFAPIRGPDVLGNLRVFGPGEVEVRLGLVQSW